MAKTPTMKPGSLAEVARHVVLPSGIVATGWPAVRKKCAEFGVEFDPWQDEAGRAIMAKRKDGSYACSIGGAVLSVPRQVGKTFMVGAIVFALCLLTPNTKVLWTAHRLRTGNETFAKMQAFAGRKRIAPHVKQVFVGSGTGEIVFLNGSRIMFGARERGFGRGFDDVDVEVFDEAQILTDNAIDDMVPATNTATNPLLFFIGTPPKPSDPSEVFTRQRSEALSGESDDTLYIEFSADEGCNPKDRKQWAKANPSFPRRTPVSAFLRLLKNLTLESFIRECLGVWDAVVDKGDPFAIDATVWAELEIADDLVDYEASSARLAVAVAHDRSWSSIGVAGTNDRGFSHLKVVACQPGTQWVPAFVADVWRELGNGAPLAMMKNESLVADVEALGVDVLVVDAPEYARSTQRMLDAINADNPQIRHSGRANLTKAASIAVVRKYGDTAVAFSDRNSPGDISPLKCLTMAYGRLGVDEKTVSEPMFAVT